MLSGTRLLLIEDDAPLRRSLRLALLDEDFEVLEAGTGRDGLTRLEETPDAVLLDLGLPDVDGIDLCRQIRAETGMPVVIITARTRREDVAAAMAAGADDYVSKPFTVSELARRLRALLQPPRRSPPRAPRTSGDLQLDFEHAAVTRRGQRIALTRTEFRLLCELAADPGRALSRTELLQRVWGHGSPPVALALEAHISSLQSKLDPDAGTGVIIRVGDAYRLEV